MKKTFALTSAAALCGALFLSVGCDKVSFFPAKKPDSPVIATVNGEPITAKDLKFELAVRTHRDPSFKLTPETQKELLNTVIDRRLLVQEAMKRRLAEEERFVYTIKTFWEQTLVRELLVSLNKELKIKDSKELEAWLETKRKSAKIEIHEPAKV